MKFSVTAGSRSASLKAVVIALLTLALLIPLSMVRNIIADRQGNAATAALDIRNSWGSEQVITGPVLRLPYEHKDRTTHGLSYVDEKSVFLLADQLSVKADVATETRYRGIHKVPVFTSSIKINGHVDLDALDSLGIDRQQIRWSEAELYLGVCDSMALSKIPTVRVNNNEVAFASGGKAIEGLVSQLSAPLGRLLGESQTENQITLDIDLAVNGSGSLRFLPLADNAEVSVSANWDSPSFIGRQLPASREIRDDGFDATWRSTRVGRKLPAAWTKAQDPQFFAAQNAFGVRLIQTVGLYQLIERSTKYAVLIIGLTFVTYFLMEVVANLKLHPLQYLLVGLANTLFFLLLLSISEHAGFDAAYLLSAGASTALIAGYSVAILQRRLRALLMGVVLAALYTFLYMTLKAESYALLAGATGLWFALAVVMYLTRRINWYAEAENGQKQAVDD